MKRNMLFALGLLVFCGVCPTSAQTGSAADDQMPPHEGSVAPQQTADGANSNDSSPVQSFPRPQRLSMRNPSLITGSAIGYGPEQVRSAEGSRPPYRYELSYALASSAVYRGKIPQSSTDRSNISTVLTPSLALIGRTRTGGYVFSYSATVMPNSTLDQPTQTFHDVAASAYGNLSRAWDWTASVNTGYGSENSRVMGPLSYELSGDLAVADKSNAVGSSLDFDLFTSSISGTLGWRRSEHDRISFSANNTYSAAIDAPKESVGIAGHSTTTSALLQYDHAVNDRLGLVSYGEYSNRLGSQACSTVGGGIGFSYALNRKLEVSAEGGPQLDIGKRCGDSQRLSVTGTLAARPDARTRLYVTGGRQFATAYAVNSRWDDSITGGVSRELRHFTLGADSGYVRTGSAGNGISPYKGFFVAPQMVVDLGHGFGIGCSYRRFQGSSPSFRNGSMDFATVSVQWHPHSWGFPRQ